MVFWHSQSRSLIELVILIPSLIGAGLADFGKDFLAYLAQLACAHSALEPDGLGFIGAHDEFVETGFGDDKWLLSAFPTNVHRVHVAFLKITKLAESGCCMRKSQAFANVNSHKPRVTLLINQRTQFDAAVGVGDYEFNSQSGMPVP